MEEMPHKQFFFPQCQTVQEKTVILDNGSKCLPFPFVWDLLEPPPPFYDLEMPILVSLETNSPIDILSLPVGGSSLAKAERMPVIEGYTRGTRTSKIHTSVCALLCVLFLSTGTTGLRLLLTFCKLN